MTNREPQRRGPTLADEFLDGLLWPRLLKAASLAARPQRLLFSLFLLVLVGAIGNLRSPWAASEAPTFLETLVSAKARGLQLILLGLGALELETVLAGFAHLVRDVPRLVLTEHPAATFLLGLPILLTIAVLGGAVTRSVACEFSQEIVHPWPRALAFALARWTSFFGVLVLPGAVVAGFALVLAVAGWIFFGGLPLLDILGALLFGPALFLGLLAALVLLLTTLAWPTLLAAVACEGTDAIDAAQRALAYALAQPLRILWYIAVASAIGVAAIGVVWGVAEGADRFTRAAAATWAGDSGSRALTGQYPPAAALDENGLERQPRGTTTVAAHVVDLWSAALGALAGAYAVSYFLTSSTLIYLFIRQACDGQHYSELWTPGLIESSILASMRPVDGSPETPALSPSQSPPPEPPDPDE